MIVQFPAIAARRLARREAARKPRRSKNGTPEERAAKAAAKSPGAAIKRRRSKNGTPEERAAKRASGVLVDFEQQRVQRAAVAKAMRDRALGIMSKEEFAAVLPRLNPRQYARVAEMMQRFMQAKQAPEPPTWDS